MSDSHHTVGIPEWGASRDTASGKAMYYYGNAHDDAFVADRTLVVINLTYDEVDIAVDSDRYRPMRTPKNCAVFVPKGCEIKERSNGLSDAVMVDFRDDYVDQLVTEYRLTSQAIMRFRNDLLNEDVGSAAHAIRSAFLGGRDRDELLMDSLIMDLQSRVFAALPCADRTGADLSVKTLDAKSIRRVVELMRDRLAENVELIDMSDSLGLSPFHFSRAFKQATGQSPYQALIDLRLRKACELLAEPKHRLVDIAFMTGFSSQAHMTDAFRRKLEVTPGEVRNAKTDA